MTFTQCIYHFSTNQIEASKMRGIMCKRKCSEKIYLGLPISSFIKRFTFYDLYYLMLFWEIRCNVYQNFAHTNSKYFYLAPFFYPLSLCDIRPSLSGVSAFLSKKFGWQCTFLFRALCLWKVGAVTPCCWVLVVN